FPIKFKCKRENLQIRLEGAARRKHDAQGVQSCGLFTNGSQKQCENGRAGIGWCFQCVFFLWGPPRWAVIGPEFPHSVLDSSSIMQGFEIRVDPWKATKIIGQCVFRFSIFFSNIVPFLFVAFASQLSQLNMTYLY